MSAPVAIHAFVQGCPGLEDLQHIVVFLPLVADLVVDDLLGPGLASVPGWPQEKENGPTGKEATSQ